MPAPSTITRVPFGRPRSVKSEAAGGRNSRVAAYAAGAFVGEATRPSASIVEYSAPAPPAMPTRVRNSRRRRPPEPSSSVKRPPETFEGDLSPRGVNGAGERGGTDRRSNPPDERFDRRSGAARRSSRRSRGSSAP